MAVLAGTILGVSGFTTPSGTVVNASGVRVMDAYLRVTFSGTYALVGGGGGAELLAVPTAMQSFMHTGTTITLLQAALAAPGDEAGTPIGIGQVTVSGANMTFVLTGGDLVTEHSAATLGAVDVPIEIFVSYTETP